MSDADTARCFNELSREVFRLTSRLNSLADRLASDAGMSSARWQVLETLAEHGPMTVAAIGRRMGLQRQSVQRTADCLAEEACLRFADNPHHRRAKLVVITPAGRQALAHVQQKQRQWVAQLGNALPEDELQTATLTLRQLRQILDTQHGQR